MKLLTLEEIEKYERFDKGIPAITLKGEEFYSLLATARAYWELKNDSKTAQETSIQYIGQVLGPRKLLKGFIHPKGYKHVFLGNGDCSKVHRLVAEAFIPNPDNKSEVNHKDGDKLNNSVDNLEWCTHSENMQHAVSMGLHKPPSGEKSPRAILTQKQVNYIREVFVPKHAKYGQSALGRLFGVSNSCVWRVVHNNNWN